MPDEPTYLAPETFVKKARTRAATLAERRDAYIADAGTRFDELESGWRDRTLEKVHPQYRDATVALAKSLGLWSETSSAGPSPPIIEEMESEAADARPGEEMDSASTSDPPIPAWMLKEPAPTSKGIEIDRSKEKTR